MSGIKRLIELDAEVTALRAELDELRSEVAALRTEVAHLEKSPGWTSPVDLGLVDGGPDRGGRS